MDELKKLYDEEILSEFNEGAISTFFKWGMVTLVFSGAMMINSYFDYKPYNALSDNKRVTLHVARNLSNSFFSNEEIVKIKVVVDKNISAPFLTNNGGWSFIIDKAMTRDQLETAFADASDKYFKDEFPKRSVHREGFKGRKNNEKKMSIETE